MLQVLNIINNLSAKGVKITFVQQLELSTTGSHGKLLLAIYSYFAEAEREFISMRVKQGLTPTRAKGVKRGRPYKSSIYFWEQIIMINCGSYLESPPR
ncbi:MAG: hypothetical protein DWQ04_17340 [Chloroflexi bacterium]|nr:MAG: hypothetical protein DWQ04_17340 [Chloroflexota bacterium]